MVNSSSAIGGGQSQGFFTSVSSNGSANPIVWALSHPVPGLGSVMNLYAFDPEAKGSALKPIFQSPAGTWPNPQNNSNQVPVVANGRVFVASSGQLQIFGLLGSGKK